MDCVGCDKCKLWGKLQVGWCCSLDFVTGEIVSARGVSPNLRKGTDDSFWGRYMTDQWKFCHGLGCVARCWHWQEHPRLHWNVRHCIVRWGLSSATINSLHDSVHPPDTEINPPKTACARVTTITKNTTSHTCRPQTLWNAFVNVQLYIIYIYIYQMTTRVFNFGMLQ